MKNRYMAKKNEIQETACMDVLFERISDLIEQARQRVMKSVNIAEVYTKFEIGRYIVYDEQQGENRAQYGKKVLKELSVRLTERFGDGWSVESLKLCRRFFMVYSNSVNSVYPILILLIMPMQMRKLVLLIFPFLGPTISS